MLPHTRMAKIKKKKKEKIISVDEDVVELKLTHIGGRSECKMVLPL